jgi:hypothetical protein
MGRIVTCGKVKQGIHKAIESPGKFTLFVRGLLSCGVSESGTFLLIRPEEPCRLFY